jgi:5-methylcytosine-specific restriction protein A
VSRTEFSTKIRDQAYERSGGFCECGCGRPLVVGQIDYDHRIPWDISRDSTLQNCVCMLRGCHRTKTRADIRDIAKGRRIRRKHRGIHKRSGFATNRDGPFKRKLDGTIEKRR